MEGNAGPIPSRPAQGLDLLAPPDLCYNYRGCISMFRKSVNLTPAV